MPFAFNVMLELFCVQGHCPTAIVITSVRFPCLEMAGRTDLVLETRGCSCGTPRRTGAVAGVRVRWSVEGEPAEGRLKSGWCLCTRYRQFI